MNANIHIKLINAGAGSGKTYTISHKVLEHIEGGGSVGEILVTTFTVPAAQELRERIAEDLIAAGRMEEAMKVDDAWIGTVHSLGKRMIDLFTFEAAYAPDQDVIPEEDEKFVFGQVMAQALSNQEFATLTAMAEELQIPDWQKNVHEIVKKSRENNIDLATHEEMAGRSFEKFMETVYNPLTGSGPQRPDQVIEILREIINQLHTLEGGRYKQHQKVIEAINPLIEACDAGNCIGIENYDTVQKLLSKKQDTDEREEVFGFARIEFQSCFLYFFTNSFQTPLQDLVQKYLQMLFRAAHHSYSEYIEFKKQRGLMDFSDQENEFLMLLENKSVQDYVSQKFKLMLVDEFQDTNPMQLAIFMQLSGHIDKVFFVGDPKQSIYAFRGADPILTGQVFQRLEKADPLKISRRSRHDLVDFSNHIFTRLFNDQEAGLEKWDVLKEEPDMKLAAPIQMWNTGITDNIGQRIRNIVGHLQDFIEGSHPRYIEKLSKQCRSAGYGQVAVLCKSNADVAEWAAAFEAAGIEVSAERDDLPLQAEYVFLMAALAFLADQGNTLAITELVLLGDEGYAGNMEGLIDHRLEALQDGGVKWMHKSPVISRLMGIAPLIEKAGVKEILEQIIVQLDVYGITASWGKAPVRKANIQKLLGLAEEYENRCIIWSTAISLHGFIQWITTLDKLKQQPSGSSNAVKVMTYHKAKGLEWPIVILDGLNDTPKNYWWGTYLETDYAEFDITHPLDNRNLYHVVNPFGKRFSYLKKEDVHKQAPDFILTRIMGTPQVMHQSNLDHAESIRRLYVGITRARDYLIIPSPKELPGDSWWKTTVDSFLSGFFENEVSFQVEGLEIEVSTINEAETSTESEIILSDYFPAPAGIDDSIEPKMISPSGLEGEDDDKKYATCFSEKHRFDSGRIPGSYEDRDLGDAVHTLLASWDPGQPAEERKAKILDIAEAFKLEDLDAGKWDSRVSEFYRWIEKQFPGATLHREIPLRLAENGQVYSGIADLVIETDKGYILVDHKSYQGTDTIGHSGKFYQQLQAYVRMLNNSGDKKVIEKCIFYPVSGVVVELKLI